MFEPHAARVPGAPAARLTSLIAVDPLPLLGRADRRYLGTEPLDIARVHRSPAVRWPPGQLGAVAQVSQLFEADVPPGRVARRLAVIGESHGQPEDSARPVGFELEAQDGVATGSLQGPELVGVRAVHPAHAHGSPSPPSMISRWRSSALRWLAHRFRYGASHSSTSRSGSGLTR